MNIESEGGIYTAADFKDQLLDLYNGKIESPRKWRNRMQEFLAFDKFKQRAEIQKSYELLMPYITRNGRCYVNPYVIDWDQYLNENERSAFMVCRCMGYPFYPEFQVGRRFIDLANPVFKIGIEIDSKTYHTLEKDIERDEELYALGWKIYHLESSEVYWNSKQNRQELDLDYHSDEDGMNYKQFLETTLEGIIKSIAYVEFGFGMPQGFEDIAHRTAYKHLLIDPS